MKDPGAWWKRAQPTTNEAARGCTPFTLPSLGVVQITADHYIELEADALFVPKCPSTETVQVSGGVEGGVSSIADMRDPFHASITPQAYATGAATVIAWMLVIMLIITPRTFFVGGASGRSGLMGRRGMIGGASGGGSITGVGTRPWLQKAAALTVAISLTLATADTFQIAERQYNEGFMDAMQLRDEVVSGMEIKVSRVISDIFLWLAQVQTLIRLFPRHKEKVIIKWVGFALILLDITFNCLNSFGPYNTKRSPRHFETAIPALSYLFQLSLSMLYAAWVMYYAITKRRYAFYHPMMWNLSLVALLSIVAILTPVVFFIIDISNYTIAGWGDYFRWVGAAAASVIVWEWVERIEALEREERKDGILGREIYDGDEMLDTTPSHELGWHGSNQKADAKKRPRNDGNYGAFTSGHTARFTNLAQRLAWARNDAPNTEARKKRTIHISAPPPAARRSESGQRSKRNSRTYLPLQSPPPVIASPVSRTDTASADSTVYTVRYHPMSDTPPLMPVQIEETLEHAMAPADSSTQELPNISSSCDPEKGVVIEEEDERIRGRNRWNWQAFINVSPFRRKGRSPPPEIQRGRVIEPLGVEDVTVNIPQRNYTGLALKDRLGTFAAQQGEKFRSKKNTVPQAEMNLPVTIIPAQPRGRTWSPEILQQHSEDITSEAGLRVDRVQPRSVPATAVEANSSSTQVGEIDPSGSQGESGASSTPNRTSRIRFTPETFQRPNARQQADTQSRPPSQSSRGSDLQGPFPVSFDPQQSAQSIGRPDTSTRSDHDR